MSNIYVAPSEMPGEDADNHALKIAAMFGGATMEAEAPVARNFKTLRRPTSARKKRLSAESLFSDGGSDTAATPSPRKSEPRGVVVAEELSMPTTGGWAAKFAQKEAPPKITRRKSSAREEIEALARSAAVSKGQGLAPPSKPSSSGSGSRPLSFIRTSPVPKPEVVKATPKPEYTSRPISVSPPKPSRSQSTSPPKTAYAGGPPISQPVPKRTPAPAASGIVFKPSGPQCPVCHKSVYKMEEVLCENTSFHKWCFRCSIPDCNKRLTAGKYASYQGQFYCKPCFMKCFKQNGNYDVGFGHEQHKMKWNTSPEKQYGNGGTSPEKEVVVKVESDL